MQISNTTPGREVNETNGHAPRHYSRFPLKRRRYQTMRFGEITPHLAMEAIGRDTLPLHSSHDIRSYTLKAPLMSNLTMKKDYFSIPLHCILPENADKIITNPTIGDDVSIGVNGVVDGKNFVSKLSSLYGVIKNNADGTAWDSILSAMIYLEYFFSSGSLVRQLGYSFSGFFTEDLTQTNKLDVHNKFDYLFEHVIGVFKADVVTNGGHFFVKFYKDNTVYLVDLARDYSDNNALCFNDFMERIRQLPIFGIYADIATTNPLAYDSSVTDIHFEYFKVTVPDSYPPISFNMVSAYQIICHHFYSNDFIDYIYSAELYRQLMKSYQQSIDDDTVSPFPSFTYNGVKVHYDALSGYIISNMIILSSLDYGDCFTGDGTSMLDNFTDELVYSLSYVSALFSFRRSLKYVDYFTGSRSQAIAVGNTDVAVVNNAVSVVETTRRIQWQRFLNFVQRVGRKVDDYAANLLGISMPYDYHNPMMLAHTSDEVRGIENENTAEAQMTQANSVTSVLRSNADKYAFEYHCDMPWAYVIGVTYFDIPRAWAFSNDKQVFHADRFDFFNPFLELQGDQEISTAELGMPVDKPFGYVQRYMEYKQTYDIACGGFVDNLPGWAFVGLLEDLLGRDHISPDFIRSHNYELDKFYLSQMGTSLSKYFHFIVVNTNDIDARRPMTNDPQIL